MPIRMPPPVPPPVPTPVPTPVSNSSADPAAGRHGIEPVVHRRVNANDEAREAVLWLLDQRRAGHAWREMVVVAPGKRNWRDPIARALAGADMPCRMLLGDPTLATDGSEDLVHVMTLHAVAALEFRVVAIVGVGDLPWKTQTLEEATALVRAAMGRATHALSISWSKPSALVRRVFAG